MVSAYLLKYHGSSLGCHSILACLEIDIKQQNPVYLQIKIMTSKQLRRLGKKRMSRDIFERGEGGAGGGGR